MWYMNKFKLNEAIWLHDSHIRGTPGRICQKMQWPMHIFQQYYFFVLVRGGDADKRVLWYWSQWWQGLYNIISALPDWAELNEFHVITGSVCKQPHMTAEAPTQAPISRSFSLFSASPFLSLTCSFAWHHHRAYRNAHTYLNRHGTCTHTRTHTNTYTHIHCCTH